MPLVFTFLKILANEFDESEIKLLHYKRTYIVGTLKPRTNERRNPLFSPEFWNYVMVLQKAHQQPPTTVKAGMGVGRLNAHFGKANPDMRKFLTFVKSEILLNENEILNFNIGRKKLQ